ncbi:SpoIIE family protein phosphatase [Geobacter sp. FeAm09]|uniref:SpoIIE family protein phosphatase n=1 Tax=Geobacter sp. FeAm09 TaxID=2597769 RepID=UPI0011EDB2B4|nr:SpoIIE family protein phosphatase [Geobacter sp. FeAm09]QEM69301.1 SpoIIE family protein phosphatase [Geobacter sp. FeAm09]
MELRSIKAKFITIIVLVYLAVGVVTLFAFYSGSNRIIAVFAQRFATKEALLEKNKIISIIDREVALARKMSDDPVLKNWAVAEADPRQRREALEQLESYRRSFRDRSCNITLAASRTYYSISEGDKRGAPKTTVLHAGNPADAWYFATMREVDGYALNLDYDRLIDKSKVWINAIMKGADGKKIGIASSGLDITDFLNEIVYSKEKGLSTILIDRSGIVQAHENRKIVEHNANERDKDKKVTIYSLMDERGKREELRAAIATLASQKSEVVAFPARFGGKNYLAAISFMPGVDWFNVVLVDVSRVISMGEFLPIVVIMFASLLLVIVTIALLMNRMVLAPLTNLSAATRQVAGGRYDITLPVTRRDEIGELTATFNAMTGTVADYTNNLEAKVRERTDELSTANRMLEESRNRIMESISYARTLQTSILPEAELMARCLGEHCVLYRPKEIVGGDFYYLREFPGHSLLACIDCTGHGVPGAFMTMTVNSVMNHVVDVICSDDPARILRELNRVMQQTLRLRDVDAGFDIALCLLDRRAGRLLFAGAGLSLYIASAQGVREIKGDHQRVGYKGSRQDFAYTNHEVALAPGDACYLTTDGLLDEPGGDLRYGFGSQRFKAMLAGQARLAMPAQAEAFERTLSEYRGANRQRDDVTLVGFRPERPTND